MFFLKDRRSLTLIELLAVICLILILTGIFLGYLNLNLRIARERALQSELMNIRMSIGYYRIIKGNFPENLSNLLNEGLTYAGSEGKITSTHFLEPFRVDREGNLLDPFMNRYVYNNTNGTVYSQAERYKRW